MPVSKYWAGLFHPTSGAQPRGAAALPSPPAGIGESLTTSGGLAAAHRGDKETFFFPIPVFLGGWLPW